MRIPGRVASVLIASAVLAGCVAPAPSPGPAPSGAAKEPAASASITPGTPAEQAPATPAARHVPADTRSGAGLDQPYEVDGVTLVSPAHRVSARYAPPWRNERHGLRPEVWAAFGRLVSAAKADGLRMELRSGYRSYADQAASFRRAVARYGEATARLYFAEAGASEHQTGLSLDAWDGTRRGSAFATTKQAAWLAAHAHEHGFIVRYPQGKTEVTGYAWESWHLRWVGTEIAARFGTDPTLTLEEYLGVR